MKSNIVKLFVGNEIAIKLKENGFSEACLAWYNLDPILPSPTFNLGEPFNHEWCLPIPLWEQVIDWLRNEHNLRISNTFIPQPVAKNLNVSTNTCHWFVKGDKPEQFADLTDENYNVGREQIIHKAIDLI